MLTKQHRFAAQILHPREKQVYKTHMCGLCHALGDRYGLLSRLLTNHEMILLSMLTNAQSDEDFSIVMRRCPLNPARHVQTNQNGASTFAAAAAVELARASVLDDVQDSRGWDISAQVIRLLMGKAHQTAIRTLEKLGFDSATFARLVEHQMQAEDLPEADPAAPTAMTSASLFAMTARLAKRQDNAAPLAAIGASYGAYLYLMDAYRDYPDDITKGQFNPLRQYTEFTPTGFELTHDGLHWLLTRFETIYAEIQTHWQQVEVVRYRASLENLLLKPIAAVIEELRGRLTRPLQFRRWSMADVLKAAFFIFPVAAAGILTTNMGDFEPVIDGVRKGRKGAQEGSSLCGAYPCYLDPSLVECCDAEDTCDMVECAENTPCDCTPGCDTDNCSTDDSMACLGCLEGDNCDIGGCDCNT